MIPWSDKQRLLLYWWANEKYKHYDGIICHGAIRSGKTVTMGLSFIIWAMSCFDGGRFAICGKTISSVRRNLAEELPPRLRSIGMKIRFRPSANLMDITFAGRRNRFYFFGGRDEGSAALIQGLTLSGLLADEAALMPRSFVEQAVARCSAQGSKLWFNCNPDGPYHWFKREWVDRAQSKNLFCVHFTMADNPCLSPEVRARYNRLYTGAFYRRFILGQWATSEGLVYPMFDPQRHTFSGLAGGFERYAVSCDYGTVNPSSFGLWGKRSDVWYRLREYYYDSRITGQRRTDEEHYEGLRRLIGDLRVDVVVCDPSAQSFIECIRRHGEYRVMPAINDVVGGIRQVGDLIRSGRLMFSRECRDTLREFTLYRWDEGAGYDRPLKEDDHAMDDIRYFVTTVVNRGVDGFYALLVDRE